ncbi:hypothetical protein EDB85DRAFT_1923362 [Lactarius pseudohatsudake]|nr:hypothetical protein EDB85DRAFT_1976982 [Lactarius pseudohatsudake]KAH9041000.1 hypothetical protein EDB85DRAFT_1923362 [Lactarius pseudohatsudake]
MLYTVKLLLFGITLSGSSSRFQSYVHLLWDHEEIVQSPPSYPLAMAAKDTTLAAAGSVGRQFSSWSSLAA